MSALSRAARRLLIVVAFLATLQGLLHAHALNGLSTERTSSATQSCAVCIHAQTTLTPLALELPPPVVFESAPTRSGITTTPRFFTRAIPARAPPRV